MGVFEFSDTYIKVLNFLSLHSFVESKTIKKCSFLFSAPPNFISRLSPISGTLADAANFSLFCQVECSPLCDVFWLRNDVIIDESDERFTVLTEEIEPNFVKNDFESTASTLVFNLDFWPGGSLDREIDAANFSCQSLGNVAGIGVSSSTFFQVECKKNSKI